MDTHRISECRCPYCDKSGMDAATAAPGQGERVPTPGDYTLCVYCGEWTKFDENLALAKLTDDDYAEISTNSICRNLRSVWARHNSNKILGQIIVENPTLLLEAITDGDYSVNEKALDKFLAMFEEADPQRMTKKERGQMIADMICQVIDKMQSFSSVIKQV